MKQWVLYVCLGLFMAGCQCKAGGDKAIAIGEISLPEVKWGDQTFDLELQNQTDELRFATIQVEASFEDSWLSPKRRTAMHAILEPRAKITVKPTLTVPGNYGRAKITVGVYDVVDTLDLLLAGQLTVQKTVEHTFETPPSVVKYLQTPITLPPRVSEHPYFDNHLSRIILLLIDEGLTLRQMMAITGADSLALTDMINKLVDRGCVTSEEGRFHLTFTVLGAEEVGVASRISERVADTLAAVISHNLDAYRRVMDSLVAAGSVKADTLDRFHTGTPLHHLYPTISALLLWFQVGQNFITRNAPFVLYDNTDPCNADIDAYMYAIAAPDSLNGTHYYVYTPTGATYVVRFGDEQPQIECEEEFLIRAQQRIPARFTEATGSEAEVFRFDSTTARPVLKALGGRADSLMWQVYIELRDIATSYGHPRLDFGYRYWFWNLTATRVVRKLVAADVIHRRGNGQFRFDGYREPILNKQEPVPGKE